MAGRASWFLGLPAPAGTWFAELPAPPAATRAFAATDLHFTIAFLGAVDEAAARAAWTALRWPLGARDVTLGAVAPLGPPRRWSSLSFLLDDRSAHGRSARTDVEAAIAAARGPCCAAAGVVEDPRPALAHLTFARPQRRATDAERAAALAWGQAIVPPAAPLRLARLALYTWAEDRRAALFRIVDERALPDTDQ